MKRFGLAVFSIVTALFVGAPAAQATVVAITPGNDWHEFDVDDLSAKSGGLEWIDYNDGSALSFTFTLTKAAILTVVDGAFGGDAFQVFDHGAPLGFTSPGVNTYPNSTVLDFDASLADPNYSRGIFTLLAGEHVITGLLSTSIILNDFPLNATVGALRLETIAETPLPATLPLFVSGLAALGFVARRRKRQVA
jgi:hypothetical protein